MDAIAKFVHGVLAFIAIAGVIFLAIGEYIIAIVLLVGVWNFDRYFQDKCLGFYVGRREDCSVDYVIPKIIHNSENLNDDDIIDTEFIDAQKKDACKQIGFKTNTYYMEIPSCEDKQGNIHFVKFDCTMLKLAWDECSAKEIKVGEVWGTSVKTANGK